MLLFVFVVEQNKNELLAQNISVLKINRIKLLNSALCGWHKK